MPPLASWVRGGGASAASDGRVVHLFAAVKIFSPVLHFFFDATGAKKKLTKRNAENVSLSAESDKGYAPLTALAF